MRSVQLAQHLGEKVLEIVIVVYVGHELGVILPVAGPVDAMDGRIIELLVDLFPYMLEKVVPFGSGFELIVSGKGDRSYCVSSYIYL